MQAGLTNQAMLLRRHMLEHNGDEIARRMIESGFDNPVGIIVEMTDNDSIPTFLCVFHFEDAKRLMARTSDSAEEHFDAPGKPGTSIVVVIARGGNTYAHVPLC